MISESVDIIKSKSSIVLFHRGTGRLLVFDIAAEEELLKLQSLRSDLSHDSNCNKGFLFTLRKHKMLRNER